MEAERAQAILQHNQDRLLQFPNVVAVGIGSRWRAGRMTDETCLAVFVRRKIPSTSLNESERIPTHLATGDGETIATDVIESGDFEPTQNRKRYRPFQGGCSIGLVEKPTKYATGGGLVYDTVAQRVGLLCCAHTVTHLGTPPVNRIVVQPSIADGGTELDRIGELARWIEVHVGEDLRTVKETQGDAALIALNGNLDYYYRLTEGEGGFVLQTVAPRKEMRVSKVGRTTGYTRNGIISHSPMVVPINYGTRENPLYVKYANSFAVMSLDSLPFSGEGDSGALVYYEGGGVQVTVGHIFGKSTDAPISVCTSIKSSEQHLKIEAVPKKTASRALLRAAYGHRASSSGEPSEALLRRSEAIAHRFHARYAETPAGREIFSRLERHAFSLARLYVDRESIRLGILETLSDFLFQADLERLESARIDEQTARRLDRVLELVERELPLAGEMADTFRRLSKAALGGTVADLFTELPENLDDAG